MGVSEVFAKRKKRLDFHPSKMVLDPKFIPWLGMDDKPMESAKPFRQFYSIF
jgi:hypothetical protein